jgi:glycosyltransferase involved in cell wall biosynthesis
LKILFLSHTPAGGPFVVGSHHLARGLAAQGHQVVHLSPPVTPAHLLKLREPFERERVARWWRGGSRVDGFIDLVPAGLWPWALAARGGGDCAARFGRGHATSVRRLLARHAMLEPDLVFIDEPRLAHVLTLINAGRVVYRPTDLYAQMRGDPAVLEAERRLVASAQAFIATSEPVAAHLRALGAPEVLVLENGVDLDRFRPDADGPCPPLPPGPRVVYTGALDERFGTAALVAAARACPQAAFVLAGPPGAALRAAVADLPNVHLLGALPYASMPALLARCQLALLPLSAQPANAGRSPMKLYEYAASGLSVVASHSPELARRAPSFVRLADGAAEFGAAVAALIALPRGGLGSPQAEARQHGWDAKCREALAWALADTHAHRAYPAPQASGKTR